MKVEIKDELMAQIDKMVDESPEKVGMKIERWVFLEQALKNFIDERSDAGRRITFNYKTR